jgi:hypothetical protein
MRSERRRRARAARRERWPARRVPGRASRAVGGLDAGVVVVRSRSALRGMVADLYADDRAQPVIGLACLEETGEPVLAGGLVRAVVGAGPRIYYLPGERLRQCLQGVLGRRLALPAGGVRVWWPGMAAYDPGAHPLVVALDSESQGEMLEEFARQFDLSRPRVRSEIEVIEDARRLAEDELARARRQNRIMETELAQAGRDRPPEADRGERR